MQRPTRGRLRNVGVVLILASIITPHLATAQEEGRWDAPHWVGDLTFASLNSISGGLSAGLFSKLRGGSFREAFAAGMAGGAVHYAGMRLAAERFSGAGMLGRQLSATGASMSRNAAEGRGPLERLWFAAGPLNLYVAMDEGVSISPKVNLPAIVSLVYLGALPETEFDLGATFSAGVPVLRSPGKRLRKGDTNPNGLYAYGTILLGDVTSERRASVFAHERVHALQADWDLQVWSHPMEDAILRRIPGTRLLNRYVDLNLLAPSLKLSAYQLLGVDDVDRLNQLEANFLEE